MLYKKYLLVKIVILFLTAGVIHSCKSETKSSSPYPSVLSVKITPENPRTARDLSIIMEGLEGKDLTFKYLWKRTGEEIFGEAFKTLRSSNFAKHDTITVVVTPVQGETIGKSIESDPVVIMNTSPVLSLAMVRPQPAYTNSQLEAIVEASDDDDDYVVFSYVWIKNGQNIFNETSSLLSSENFKRGDSIQCIVTPSDREAKGKSFTTTPIVIANSPPSITSQPPSSVMLKDSLTYRVVADDLDQDKLVFSLVPSVPKGMAIDPATGVIKWKIPKDFTGVCPIEIIVSDEYGGRCSQRFDLSIGESTG